MDNQDGPKFKRLRTFNTIAGLFLLIQLARGEARRTASGGIDKAALCLKIRK